MKMLITLTLFAILAACGKPEEADSAPQPQVVQQPGAAGTPVVVQQAPQQQDHSLLYGVIGYMLGSGNSSNHQPVVVQQPGTRIIERRTIIQQAPAPSRPVTSAYRAPAPAYKAPAPTYKPVTTPSRPTYSYRPSTPTRSFSSPSFRR